MRLCVAIVITTGCAAPGADPAATATSDDAQAAGEGWEEYTSERFGFSLALPGEWRYRAATEDWPAGEYPTAGAAYVDNFEQPPASFPTVDIATRALASGETEAAFLEWLDEQNARFCTVEESGTVVVDGEEGRLQRQTCGYNAWEAVVLDREQVYLIYWLGDPSRIAADRELFEQVVGSFRFADG